ncbi:MAG: HAD hydrolase-like protein [Candidatus Doudnabacteria bacterium]|nr:HAD hydrolase-like protein [Candidatus Doudnabacteria bacterium]
MIKLVAFDWNGTLLADTLPSIQAENSLMKELGVNKKITLREYQNYFCIPINEYFKALGFSEKFFAQNSTTIFNGFYKYYEPLEKKCRTRGGTKQILAWLNKSQVAAVIYSNHFSDHIKKQTARLKISGHFAEILGRPLNDDSHMRSRGKIALLKNCIKKRGLRKEEVITLGDTEEEIDIGKSLGIITVAITGGYNSETRLKKRHPDFLIHNMLELKKIVKKLNYK